MDRFHFNQHHHQAGNTVESTGFDSPLSTTSSYDSSGSKRGQLLPTSDALWGFDDALAQSLHALTFTTDDETSSSTTPSTISDTLVNTRRPRSYSDYTALGNNTRWRANGELSEFGALWDAIRTDFASRHVVVRCGAGTWDSLDVRRIVDRLNHFGTVARTRRELTAGGLLFCTFFDITSAVAAFDRWRADADIISFCLPYELPDDVNSASLLVHFKLSDRSPVTVSELRQVCTYFGQVASVLQPDTRVAKFVIEYCDSRILPAALNGLPRAFQTSGPLSVARTMLPTLDVNKLKLFQECLNRAAAAHPRVTRARPKSFSSISTSLLTSPTSSVASSLNASLLEGASNDSPLVSGNYAGGGRKLTSPVLMPQDEQPIWARPVSRARSNSSTSTHLGRSLSSGRFGESMAYSNGFTLPSSSSISTRSNCANGFSSFPAAHRSQSSNTQISLFTTAQQASQQQQAYYDSRGQRRAQTNFSLIKSSYSNNGPFIQTSVADSGGHAGVSGGGTTARLLTGRNDQGTGEFSLSINKVVSGADKRTTLMIRNIPNKYTQQMLLTEINRNHCGNYDFFYLPIDFKNKCNMGYAFINFIEAARIEAFHQEFDGQKWTNFNSEKVCAISYARLQGKQAMVARFQNSSLLEKHESYRPLVFGSSGPNRGKPELFPAPKQTVYKKQSVHAHSSGMFGADDYGNYVAHRMYAQQPLQQHHGQQQHLLAVYRQQMVGIPQHAMPPLPIANGHPYLGMQGQPEQYIPSYQQDGSQLASPFLYGVAGISSNVLDYMH
ncbi:unnamed protein product [Peronospora belbahrii]|uniref:Mei2-like C-terminal RNA recognition motif domain-containing protein n=1 Tax=Peronospora belbahrii TaxID=622444 RepID=A0AAU9LBV5_9STRA|nr:unnamed protein product [Peronospora belbahrii]